MLIAGSEDKEEKHPEVNVNKEGEVAADNDEEVECADERTDVVRPMDWEVKFPLRRYGIYQVNLEISLQGSTGSHVGSHQLPGLEHQIEEQDDMWTGFFCTERDSGVLRDIFYF